MFKKEYPSLNKKRKRPESSSSPIKVPDGSSSSSSSQTTEHKKSSIFDDVAPVRNTTALKKRMTLSFKGDKSPEHKSTLEFIPDDDSGPDGPDADSSDDNLIAIPMPMKTASKRSSTEPVSSKEGSASADRKFQKEKSSTASIIGEELLRKISTVESTMNTKQDLIGDLLNEKVDTGAIKKKFESLKIPKVTNSKKELAERVSKHLHIIPDLLNGTIDMSEFYNRAKEQKNEGAHKTLRQADKYRINWEKFFGGYYGVKRQLYIANLILEEHSKAISSAGNRNSTVTYWGTQDFCQYVLANEIIIRLAMEDYNVGFDDASKIILDTPEYGSQITDLCDLEDPIKQEKPKKKGLTLADVFK